MAEKILELEIRRKMYNIILENPGLHASRISELLGIQSQLADYHLFYLERQDLVTAVKEEGYRRYYAKGVLGSSERKWIALLRQEIPLRIVLLLLKKPMLYFKEIVVELAVAKSTCSYHLKKLVKHGLVQEHIAGKDKQYTVVNEDVILNLLIRYKPYSRIENFEDTWMDLRWPGSEKK